MPRQPRLDAPGTLHHVIGRGIERTRIFRSREDREDFLARVADLCEAGALSVYAWALMGSHFHLLVRSGKQSLSQSMRQLLTGYAVNFNRRHKRWGHLFQNRYKSIICEEDPYLLELTRYIHLNPIRAGLVRSIKELARYPWAGHSAIVGKVKRSWQDRKAILAYFGRRRREAVRRYEGYMEEGVGMGRKPELVGGGLIRSLGGWSQVISFRRKGDKVASDGRILGSGEFVEELLSQAGERVKETLRLQGQVPDLGSLAERVVKGEKIKVSELRGGSRRREVVRGRRILSQLAVKRYGYSGASVARFLGVTTSLVNRMANSEEEGDSGPTEDAHSSTILAC